jgi:hypothetical protein
MFTVFFEQKGKIMKKMIVCALVTLCLSAVPSLGFASTDDYKTRLKDGFETITTSPKPLIDSVTEEYNSAKFKPFGVFGGLFKGSFYAVKQFARGLYQVMTFNVSDDNFVSNMFTKEGSTK